jgi:hypothetical protein
MRNERICLKLSDRMREMTMSRVQYLREQAARAERLSQGGFDPLTTERLKQAAQDFRRQAEQLAASLS